MLTSIAAIATAVTAIVGLVISVRFAIKKNNEKKWVDLGRSLEQQVLEAETDEERAKLAKSIHDHEPK